jgi:FdhD protein
MEIRLDGERLSVTMRTPGADFELAAGWVVHEGLAVPGDLRGVAYCTDEQLAPDQEFNVVTVTLDRAPARKADHRHLAASSGSSACGVCGKDTIEAALHTTRATRRWPGPALSPDVVRRLPDALREHQPLFDRTGGSHAAGIAGGDGELLVVREDVGRHNAVDKATGARVLAGQPTAEAALVVSGRAGFELVQKAVAAGVGALVAVGAPSALAVSLAQQAELEVYGFTSQRRCVRFA